MTNSQTALLSLFLLISVAFLVIPLLVYGVRRLKSSACDDGKTLGISRMLLFTVNLIASIWCLRYMVGYYVIASADPSQTATGLTWWEEIFNSFLHTLQTFSMDEDYTYYITTGKAMIAEIFGSDTKMQVAYGFYVSLLNFAAPIAGGAVIFEVLTSVFPKIRLFASYFVFWREKLYFSKLNEASLALAKSLCAANGKKRKRPFLIFTDAYVDNGDEQENELLLEAKRLGAICVHDDLSHVFKSALGKKSRTFFLIDESEISNIQTFVDLTDDKNASYIKKANIYLFVENDAYVRVEKQVRERLITELGFSCDIHNNELPVIIPVQSYRNLVCNLFVDVPLYEPIAHQKGKKELNVTIFGSGIIGIEALLNVYWIGQMLDCKLNITVVSQEDEAELYAKIDYVNPEIRKTAKDGNDILLYDATRRNEKYCDIRYIQADLAEGDFWNEDGGKAKEILDTDYFIVALGSDEINMRISEKLRLSVGKHHIISASKQKDGADSKHSNTVISYVVYDSNLCKVLNKNKRYCSCDPEKADIYMHAFGSLEQVYSRENVFMTLYSLWSEGTGVAYIREKHNEEHLDANSQRNKSIDEDYKYWANLARAMHIKYKVFSMGWIQSSVFDTSDEMHRSNVQKACSLYKRISITNGRESLVSDEENEYRAQLEAKKHYLAWLEHRRWNAFARIMGYQSSGPKTMDDNNESFRHYFKATGNHKNMSLKWHPCLVESCPPDARCEMDMLDKVSAVKYELAVALDPGVTPDDFKKYDYYIYEFDSYCTLEDAAKALKMSKEALRSLCAKTSVVGALEFKHGNTWLIPVRTVKYTIKKTCRICHEAASITGRDKNDIVALCEAGKIPGAVKFCNDWYIPKKMIKKLKK